MSPPLKELAHDHRELSGLLVAVHEALARVQRGESKLEDELHEMTDGLEAFREALLEHFAREQEGVLPWLVTRLPDARAQVDQIFAEHDRIAEQLTVVVRALPAGDWSAALARFEALYAEHTQSENAFFREVTAALANDDAATSRLRDLLNEP